MQYQYHLWQLLGSLLLQVLWVLLPLSIGVLEPPRLPGDDGRRRGRRDGCGGDNGTIAAEETSVKLLGARRGDSPTKSAFWEAGGD